MTTNHAPAIEDPIVFPLPFLLSCFHGCDAQRRGSAHAIVHMMEGDRDNADYWYGKAERSRSEPFILSQEIARLSWLADDESA